MIRLRAEFRVRVMTNPPPGTRARIGRTLVYACLLVVGGCTTATTIPGRPRDVVGSLAPENAVRVQVRQGNTLLLANVRTQGDSLVGVRTVSSGERIALAFEDIQTIAVQEVDGLATTMALVIGVIAVILVVYAVTGGHYTGGT